MNVSRYKELKAGRKIDFTGYIDTEDGASVKKVKATLKRYDPETGTEVAERVIPLDIASLERQEAELTDALENIAEFLVDAKKKRDIQAIPGGVVPGGVITP